MSRREVLEQLTKELTDRGQIIGAGWLSYRMVVMPGTAGKVQIEETRRAFYCGAQHLFASIMSVLEPGDEPTPADLERFDKINAELEDFARGMAELAAQGRADR